VSSTNMTHKTHTQPRVPRVLISLATGFPGEAIFHQSWSALQALPGSH